MRSARLFVSAIEMRQQAMLKIVQYIVEHQQRCFLEGLRYIRPLLLRDVARQVSMSESTISRVVSHKYVQTDWGIVPLRYFFSPAVATDTGKYSRIEVLHIIRELIDSSEKRLTDQAISDILLQRGVRIARRTVSKYRKLMLEGSWST